MVVEAMSASSRAAAAARMESGISVITDPEEETSKAVESDSILVAGKAAVDEPRRRREMARRVRMWIKGNVTVGKIMMEWVGV